MTEDDITALARRLGRICKRRKVEISVAESCTGGGLAAAITRISGSAKWFDRGFVTYSNEAKTEMLGVDGHLDPAFVSDVREKRGAAGRQDPSHTVGSRHRRREALLQVRQDREDRGLGVGRDGADLAAGTEDIDDAGVGDGGNGQPGQIPQRRLVVQ